MTDFLTEMDQLAAEIAKKARGSEKEQTNLADQIDAFKALMPYYAHNKKLKPPEDADDDLPNFGNFQSRIHAVAETDDGAEQSGVRGSRRNGN